MAHRFGPPSHLLQVWPFEVPCSPRRSSCPPSRRRVANRQRICRAASSGIEPGWDQTSQFCFERHAVWCGTSRTSPWSRLIASADDLFRYRQLSRLGRSHFVDNRRCIPAAMLSRPAFPSASLRCCPRPAGSGKTPQPGPSPANRGTRIAAEDTLSHLN